MKFLAVILLLAVLLAGSATALGLVDWDDAADQASDRVLGRQSNQDDNPTPPNETAAPSDESSTKEILPPAPSASVAPRYIASVTTSQENGATRYHVRPTRAGRAAVGDQLDTAWDQAVHKGIPNQPGLRQQFMCHPLSFIARAKPTWDLESWRPTVGLKRTMLAACNPG